MLSLVLIILLISFFPVVFGSLIIFDLLVRREYSLHRVDWVSDGRPIGFFWVPNETTVTNGLFVKSGSSLARRKAVYGWVFATPKWVRGDRLARRLLLSLRALIFGWYGALFGLLAITLFR